ncbi:hypothetical protein GCM10007907_35190 [Chitinimonas prasina]|uniref:Uncharacterized protein n=1 Tax=Chitinimonas prasina TaxID=1434937 RepID=A0ABQ5YP59_9NEIS|nr:hypothetical protein GCM10007907_35190 [Chitinimonas prasina]
MAWYYATASPPEFIRDTTLPCTARWPPNANQARRAWLASMPAEAAIIAPGGRHTPLPTPGAKDFGKVAASPLYKAMSQAGHCIPSRPS